MLKKQFDTLNKMQEDYAMSIKNAPPRWKEIVAVAKRLGAKDSATRMWLVADRGGIPASWKLKIKAATNDDIDLKDMVVKHMERR